MIKLKIMKYFIILAITSFLLTSCGNDQWLSHNTPQKTESSITSTGLINEKWELKNSDNAKILQDVNFRVSPWTNSEIMKPILKWEFVTIIWDKDIKWIKWYNVSQNGIKGWISYLWFVNDPTKASASNCDPVHGHVDANNYCICNDWYTWSGWVKSCVAIYTQIIQPINNNYYSTPSYYSSNYSIPTYNWCTSDCSGHDAWYNWAMNNWITNTDDCTWKSNSFIEWCVGYVEDEYDGCNEWSDCEDIDSYDDCSSSNYCSNNLQ